MIIFPDGDFAIGDSQHAYYYEKVHNDSLSDKTNTKDTRRD